MKGMLSAMLFLSLFPAMGWASDNWDQIWQVKVWTRGYYVPYIETIQFNGVSYPLYSKQLIWWEKDINTYNQREFPTTNYGGLGSEATDFLIAQLCPLTIKTWDRLKVNGREYVDFAIPTSITNVTHIYVKFYSTLSGKTSDIRIDCPGA